jgi:hypothetical protein
MQRATALCSAWRPVTAKLSDANGAAGHERSVVQGPAAAAPEPLEAPLCAGACVLDIVVVTAGRSRGTCSAVHHQAEVTALASQAAEAHTHAAPACSGSREAATLSAQMLHWHGNVFRPTACCARAAGLT